MQELVRRFADLYERKRATKSQLAEINEEYKECEKALLRALDLEGVDKVSLRGGPLVYVRRELWAGAQDGDTASLVSALKKHPATDWMVVEKYNANQLSAWVRELDKEEEPVPEDLAPHLKVSEVFRLGYRSEG